MWCVYKHTSPSNKVYIGITGRNPELRWGNGINYKKSPKFWNAIKKYGWNNITHEIIEKNLTQEEATLAEQKWITYYDSYNNGYNATSGGEKSYNHRGNQILQIDPVTGFVVNMFKTAEELGDLLNKSHHMIKQMCKSYDTYYGYYWVELSKYKGSFVLSEEKNMEVMPKTKKYERNKKEDAIISKKEFYRPKRHGTFISKPVMATNIQTQEKIVYSSISDMNNITKKDIRTIRDKLKSEKPIKISGVLYTLSYV